MNTYRQFKFMKALSTVLFFINILFSVFEISGLSGKYFLNIELPDSTMALALSIFSLIIVTFGTFSSRPQTENEEILEEARKRFKLPFYLSIVIILYAIFILIYFKSLTLFSSALLSLMFYYAIVINSKNLFILYRTDRKLNWNIKYHGGVEEEIESSSFIWRYKIWYNKLSPIPFKDRKFSVFNILLVAFLLYFIYDSGFNPIFTIVALVAFIIPNTLSILESLLGLYTSITGLCTGIEYYNEDDYYEIYVTDFKHKREIKFTLSYRPAFELYDDVKVIHGMFSKKALKAFKINFN